MMFSIKSFAQGYIKLNPVSLAFGIMNLGYEQTLGEHQSLQVKLYGHTSGELYGARLIYKFFVSNKPAPEGLYLAPIVGYVGSEGDGVARVGGLIGYQTVFSNDKISFEGGIGPAYTVGIPTVLPIAALNIGIRIGGGR